MLDKCAVNWDGAKEADALSIYGKVKEEVKNIAKSRRDMITPRPMEVDRVQTDWSSWGGDWHEEEQVHNEGEQEEVEQDINYVGKGKGKGKGTCWSCGEAGHRAAECPKWWKGGAWGGKGPNYDYKGGFKGEGKIGKGGYKGAKGDGKDGKRIWPNPIPKACFGCGSTAHLMRDCPHNKTTQEVQEVRGDVGDPEVLFIAHTMVQNDTEDWEKVKKKAPRQRLLGDFIRGPPGLIDKSRRVKSKRHINGFKVLEVDEMEEDEDEEELEIRCVSCEPDVQWKSKSNHDDAKRERCKQEYSKPLLTQEPEESNIRVVKNDASPQKPAGGQMTWASLGAGEIVVDSAADESCWPKDLGGAFETRPSTRNIQLRTANGGEMSHYGEKHVTFRSANDEEVVGLKFQVTDVKKPLLAVRRLVERGNVVSFGPTPSDNYIKNRETGKMIPMERKGGSFILRADFVKEIDVKELGPVFSRQVR